MTISEKADKDGKPGAEIANFKEISQNTCLEFKNGFAKVNWVGHCNGEPYGTTYTGHKANDFVKIIKKEDAFPEQIKLTATTWTVPECTPPESGTKVHENAQIILGEATQGKVYTCTDKMVLDVKVVDATVSVEYGNDKCKNSSDNKSSELYKWTGACTKSTGDKKKGGFSGGAIFGIIVGCLAGVGVIGFTLYYFVFRK